MDDKEYYSFKRITYLTPEQLQKNLKKIADSKYRTNELRQGKADAEMLLEKQDNFDSYSESDISE